MASITFGCHEFHSLRDLFLSESMVSKSAIFAMETLQVDSHEKLEAWVHECSVGPVELLKFQECSYGFFLNVRPCKDLVLVGFLT